MGYIAKEISTNKVYYSKGANKISEKIGCNYSTLTKFFNKKENLGVEKIIKGFIVSQTIDLNNQNRGNNIKFNV
jgi:hypothetical protein